MRGFTRFLLAVLMLFLAPVAEAAANQFTIYLTQDDPAVLEKAISNAANVDTYFRAKGEDARVEIVAAGSGVNLLRTDRSPLIQQINAAAQNPAIHFSVSDESLQAIAVKEGVRPPLPDSVEIVRSASQRLAQLRDEGYDSLSYSLLLRIYFARLVGKSAAPEASDIAAADTSAAPRQ
jgi:intracellular sulfur oxidation DsrE/DsrF family protein